MSGDWTGLTNWQIENRVNVESSNSQARSTERTSTTSDSSGSDDLTKIHGIGPATAELLRKSGITSFRELHDAGSSRIREILASGGSKFTLIDSSLWESQARFAMSGDWTGLTRWQIENRVNVESSDSQVRSTVRTSTTSNTFRRDDLTRIHGIGPATADLLRRSGITSFRELHDAGASHIQQILTGGGSKFTLIDPSLWERQARFAMSGDWSGLTQWQAENRATAEGSDSQARSTERTSTTSDTSGSDDLTKIHGIGPATAELLRKSGITSFRELRDTRPERTREILASGGSRFTLIDSSLWATQARFATSGDWDGLTRWQTENREAVERSDSRERSTEHSSTTSNSFRADDLTEIRGIGPATNKVLLEKGITRFEQIANLSSQQLADLFAGMENRFQMQDTSTWPAQAQKLAGQRSSDDDGGIGVLEDINSIRAMASGSDSTSRSTSDSRINSDKS